MPSLGADMETGTLLEWRVAPGDVVHRGDIVALVDTDKAEIEVEIFCDGVIEALLVEPGRKVPVGTLLARLREPGAETAHAPHPRPRPRPPGRARRASPRSSAPPAAPPPAPRCAARASGAPRIARVAARAPRRGGARDRSRDG